MMGLVVVWMWFHYRACIEDVPRDKDWLGVVNPIPAYSSTSSRRIGL